MITPTILNNRYKVIRILGSGGFGETFLAEDTQMPSGRRCVIKQLKPVVDNPQVYQLVQERFQREAAILEELGDSSNNIPRLYAYFVENGEFFLVQEYIEGETLTQKLQQEGLLSESSVKEILISILPILDYVHSKRIVHRDIKPDNILIRNFDGKPVLIDFGAVKETMGTVMTVSGNSNRSIVIGTPGFMPSEQTAGRPVFSSDLYSLGLTAIYLLTGKIPQQLETDPASGEILWRHHALSISPSFASILDKAIASYARDRYSSVREMLQALQTEATQIATDIPPSIPTIISIPQPNPYVQTPTVVSAPGVPYKQPVYSPPPAKVSNGIGDVQKAVIMGGVIGAFVVGGLWLTRGQFSRQKESTTTVVESTPSPIPSESTLPTSNSEKKPDQSQSVSSNSGNSQQSTNAQTSNPSASPQSNLANEQTNEVAVIPSNTNISNTDTSSQTEEATITQEDAKNVINNWLQAKRVMFAPPYNFQPASELTVGEEYENVAGADGSINSLKNDGHYYKYGIQKIDNVDDFSVNGNQAVIQVKVTEDRTLFDRNGNILPKETDFKTRTVRYNLLLVDGRWKIASKKNFTD